MLFHTEEGTKLEHASGTEMYRMYSVGIYVAFGRACMPKSSPCGPKLQDNLLTGSGGSLLCLSSLCLSSGDVSRTPSSVPNGSTNFMQLCRRMIRWSSEPSEYFTFDVELLNFAIHAHRALPAGTGGIGLRVWPGLGGGRGNVQLRVSSNSLR